MGLIVKRIRNLTKPKRKVELASNEDASNPQSLCPFERQYAEMSRNHERVVCCDPDTSAAVIAKLAPPGLASQEEIQRISVDFKLLSEEGRFEAIEKIANLTGVHCEVVIRENGVVKKYAPRN